MVRDGWYIDLGLLRYEASETLQHKLALKRIAGEIPDILLLVEHPPVITLGKAGSCEHILADRQSLCEQGISVFCADRGGDVTYHGPGQLVGYPIVDLHDHGKDVRLFVRNIEETIIRTVAHFGIEATRRQGFPGVWVGNAKLAALGIHVRKWVTRHGFALNVNPNLGHFKLIVPCGLDDAGVTSIDKETGQNPPLREVKEIVVQEFADVFGINLERKELGGYCE